MNQLVDRRREQGFTIIETMIATAVFSVVLLVVTIGIMQITHGFYKSVHANNTQNASRAIVHEVGQAIQFGGEYKKLTAASGVEGFCIGNTRFSYQLGKQVEDAPDATLDQAQHAMVIHASSACDATTAPSLTEPGGREMIGRHMRLLDFDVAQVPDTNVFTIRVRIAYGDNDLLFNPPGGPAGFVDGVDNKVVCRGDDGSRFCVTSELETTVTKRLN